MSSSIVFTSRDQCKLSAWPGCSTVSALCLPEERMSAPASLRWFQHQNTLKYVWKIFLSLIQSRRTVLVLHIAAHWRIVHLVRCGEWEDVSGPSDTARGTGGAVPDAELVKVESDLADVVCHPLDQVDAGAASLVDGREAWVLELGHVLGDHSSTGQQPHHTTYSEPRGTAPLRLTTLK